MYAAGRKRAGRTGLIAATLIALAGCSSSGGTRAAIDPGLIQSSNAANSERPPFFVMWRPGDMAGLTRKPMLDKSSTLPEYPPSALREEAAGKTTIEVCVTIEGRLVDIQLKNSSGSEALDNATIAWAKTTARYSPALFNNEPFAVCGYQIDWIWQVENAG